MVVEERWRVVEERWRVVEERYRVVEEGWRVVEGVVDLPTCCRFVVGKHLKVEGEATHNSGGNCP